MQLFIPYKYNVVFTFTLFFSATFTYFVNMIVFKYIKIF